MATANKTDSFRTLNSCSHYDLGEAINLFFSENNDENAFFNDISKHHYHDNGTFFNQCKHNYSLFISINVCSLMNKFADLSDFIQQSLKNNVNIKVIALQEIWNIPYPELITIPNFHFVYKSRVKCNILCKNDVQFKILENFSYFIEKEFECPTIETLINKKKIILSNIYRSPNPSDNFISYLDTHMNNLSLKNCDSYIFLDANINLLNINHNQYVALYLETVYSNGFLQNKASRICNNSCSLIDHILYKSKDNDTLEQY